MHALTINLAFDGLQTLYIHTRTQNLEIVVVVNSFNLFLTLRVYRARLSSKKLRAIYTFFWARTDDTYLAWPWTNSPHQAYTRGSGKRMGPECVASAHQQVVDSALWYGIIQTPEPASAAGAEVNRRSPPWEVGNPSLQQQRQKLKDTAIGKCWASMAVAATLNSKAAPPLTRLTICNCWCERDLHKTAFDVVVVLILLALLCVQLCGAVQIVSSWMVYNSYAYSNS